MPLHLVGTSIRRSNGCDTGTRLAVRHNSKRSVDIGVDLRMPSAGNTTLKIALGVAIRIVIRVDLRMPGVGNTALRSALGVAVIIIAVTGGDLLKPGVLVGNTTRSIALGIAIGIAGAIGIDLLKQEVGDTGRGKTDIVEDLLKLVTGDCELRTTVTAIGVVLLDAVVWWLPLVRWIVRHGDCI